MLFLQPSPHVETHRPAKDSNTWAVLVKYKDEDQKKNTINFYANGEL